MPKQVEVGISKLGGATVVELRVDRDMKMAEISKAISRITADKDLMKKLGLKGCTACKSGLDIVIRTRFDRVLKVDI